MDTWNPGTIVRTWMDLRATWDVFARGAVGEVMSTYDRGYGPVLIVTPIYADGSRRTYPAHWPAAACRPYTRPAGRYGA